MSEASIEPKTAAKKRLHSLDALRGFVMFWIMGAEWMVLSFTKATQNAWDDAIGEQMQHVAWEGVHFYDLVFPTFMFLAGVSIPYALEGKLERGEAKRSLLLKVGKRVGLLILFGLIYNGLFDWRFESLRCASVLGQIGIAYGIAATIVIFSKKELTPMLWCGLILLGVTVAQLCVSVAGHGAGVLTQEGAINGVIDRVLLPGKLYGGSFDPEGWLCVLSSSALVLFGLQAGRLLRSQNFSEYRKSALLAGSGALMLGLGMVFSLFYPPIKSLWTTTFNFYSGGIALLALAAFYLVIDIWNVRKPVFFFTVIGMNSITIYMAYRIINFRQISDFFFAGAIRELETQYAVSLSLLGALLIQWLLLWALYQKKVFLKV